MNKYSWYIVAILLFFNQLAGAQDQYLFTMGQIVDKQTGEGIPYVNVGVLGSYLGTASNADGFFDMKIPPKHASDSVIFSAVGYKPVYKRFIELSGQDDIFIELEEQSYEVGEVDIQAGSLFYLKVLKSAIRQIPNNYYQEEFQYDLFYRHRHLKNGELERWRDAALTLYDARGYQRGNAFQVYKERNYAFKQVRKNFQIKSLADGSTALDDLLQMDIVRINGNILDWKYAELYDLKLEGVAGYENDSVWIIAYNCQQPSLTTTGDYYAKHYSGKIYINQKDTAIIKNESYVESTNASNLGRGMFVNESRQKWTPDSIRYDFTVIYKKYDSGKYFLSYVNQVHNDYWTHKESGEKKHETIESEIMVNRIVTNNPEVIYKRSYYEDMPYNKEFWDKFSFLPERKAANND